MTRIDIWKATFRIKIIENDTYCPSIIKNRIHVDNQYNVSQETIGLSLQEVKKMLQRKVFNN